MTEVQETVQSRLDPEKDRLLILPVHFSEVDRQYLEGVEKAREQVLQMYSLGGIM